MNEYIALLFPLLRGVLGWIENAFIDGIIDWPEWKRLMTTVVSLGTPIAIIAIGVQIADLDQAITIVSGIVIAVADWIYSQFTKRRAALQ